MFRELRGQTEARMVLQKSERENKKKREKRKKTKKDKLKKYKNTWGGSGQLYVVFRLV